MNKQAKQIITRLGLKPHAEGGYFVEKYRSSEFISSTNLPDRFSGSRVFSTSIYFLLPSGEISHFHRMKSDEVWHFYAGSPLEVVMLDLEGKLVVETLDSRQLRFQLNVPAGVWLGARVVEPESYSLVGCTVAPGFEFDDFQLGSRENLLSQFPQHEQIILALTAN